MWIYTVGKDAPSNSQCRSCDAPVTWVRNIATGKRIPLDGHDAVTIRLDTRADFEDQTVEAGLIELGGPDPMHASHRSTCPQADGWRR